VPYKPLSKQAKWDSGKENMM